MRTTLLSSSLALAACVWASAVSACLPPPSDAITIFHRFEGEGDVEYQERIRRQRAQQAAAEQASYVAWAINRENRLWDASLVTRIAVVDVAGVAEDDPNQPPGMTSDFIFSVAHGERGMARGEQFRLTEPRFTTNPCIPVVTYPVGGRYLLFASDGPLSRQLPVLLLLPVAEVRSERGLALLQAAEGEVH